MHKGRKKANCGGKLVNVPDPGSFDGLVEGSMKNSTASSSEKTNYQTTFPQLHPQVFQVLCWNLKLAFNYC